MEPWIFVTLLAALAQTLRFGLMRQLKVTALTSTGTTFARYLYAAPLAVAATAIYGGGIGQGMPSLPWAFWGYVALGGGAQILATICVMALFARRNFSVGIAFTETTVLMAVPVGWLLLGDTTTVWGFVAIVIGFVGVLMISHQPAAAAGFRIGQVFNVGAALGLSAGVLFALAGVGFRGAVLNLDVADPTFRALLTLAIATLGQAVIMAVWLRLRQPAEITRVLGAWRIAGLVGLTSMIGSTCWFIAFALQNVAYVNAVGQIQLIFSLALTVFVFRETIRRAEVWGGAILMGSILLLILLG